MHFRRLEKLRNMSFVCDCEYQLGWLKIIRQCEYKLILFLRRERIARVCELMSIFFISLQHFVTSYYILCSIIEDKKHYIDIQT